MTTLLATWTRSPARRSAGVIRALGIFAGCILLLVFLAGCGNKTSVASTTEDLAIEGSALETEVEQTVFDDLGDLSDDAAEDTDAPEDPNDTDGDGCHDSYSGACVPVDEGDVDCSSIVEDGFDVVGFDDFDLDADRDGIACEPLNSIDEDDDGCHDSYQGACVPVDEGDVDCPEIGVENIDVVGPDTFNLDLDYDGIGCEPFVSEDEFVTE